MNIILKSLLLIIFTISYVNLNFAEPQKFELTVEKGEKAYEKADYQTALSLFFAASKIGNAQAKFYLGNMYAQGQGVLKNLTSAENWYIDAARTGDPEFQHLLGIMYRDGKTVPKNPLRAKMWLQASSDQIYAPAFLPLADMYWDGIGVKADINYAIRLYMQSADSGDVPTQLSLAAKYRYGDRVPKSGLLALFWYENAIEKGNLFAHIQVGNMLENGEGVIIDLPGAHMHYSIAAATSHANSVQFRDNLALKMTKAQLDLSLKRQGQWLLRSGNILNK